MAETNSQHTRNINHNNEYQFGKDVQSVISYVQSLQNQYYDGITSPAMDHTDRSNLSIDEFLTRKKRPFVTLTYAQSLDGKIALKTTSGDDHNGENEGRSSNFPISGKYSLIMTHALRNMHDGVLIGSGTMKYDNPRLNNRLWLNGKVEKQPLPILIDTTMRSVIDCEECRAKNLVVCCSIETANAVEQGVVRVCKDWTIIPCKCLQGRGKENHLDLEDVLKNLYKFGIRRLMVEGGASILSAFASSNSVDALVVTVAPKLIGKNGLAIYDKITFTDQAGNSTILLENMSSITAGNDFVLYGKWPCCS